MGRHGGSGRGREGGERRGRDGRGSGPGRGPRGRRPERPREFDRAGVETAARKAAEAAGYAVVFARVSVNGRLSVMIDRGAGTPVDGTPPTATWPVRIADCEVVSRAIDGAIRAIGLDPGTFDIEVESPGADRPLTRAEDFERFKGMQVTVTLRESREGRRNFTGALVSYEKGDVTLHVLDEAAPETFKAGEIREVRLHPVPEKPPPRERR